MKYDYRSLKEKADRWIDKAKSTPIIAIRRMAEMPDFSRLDGSISLVLAPKMEMVIISTRSLSDKASQRTLDLMNV